MTRPPPNPPLFPPTPPSPPPEPADEDLPCRVALRQGGGRAGLSRVPGAFGQHDASVYQRSEEHTSELQSHLNLVCRLLLEKKKKKHINREQSTRHGDKE